MKLNTYKLLGFLYLNLESFKDFGNRRLEENEYFESTSKVATV